MSTLLIDNYDSYTYNVFHLLAAVSGEEPIVVHNDMVSWRVLSRWRFDAIVLSPGPGRPERWHDFGVCADILRYSDSPVLGICLGHQGLGHVLSGVVRSAPTAMHGRLSRVQHLDTGLFEGIPQQFSVVRYHSLAVTGPLGSEGRVTAWTRDGVVMGIEHRSRPLWGVQFHPESVATEHGRRLVENFYTLVHDSRPVARSGVRGWSVPASVAASAPTPVRIAALAQAPASAPTPASASASASASAPTPTSAPTPIPARAPAPTSAPPSNPARRGRRDSGMRLRTRAIDGEPVTELLFEQLFGAAEHAFWLDSADAPTRLAQCSYLGTSAGPDRCVLRYDVREGKVTTHSAGASRVERGSIFHILDREIYDRAIEPPEEPAGGLLGGFVGYLGYECKADCGSANAHRSDLPDATLMFANRVVAVDHVNHRTWLFALCRDGDTQAEDWLSEAEAVVHEVLEDEAETRERAVSGRRLVRVEPALGRAEFGRGPVEPGRGPVDAATTAPASDDPAVVFRCGRGREQYLADIARCQAALAAGESYEVCLTDQLSTSASPDPFELYRVLRRVNPAPFGAYLKLGHAAVLSSSPERFLSIDRARRVQARPIKGTTPRSADPLRDEALCAELLHDEKTYAEHLMIVDLLRNDLGRVCDIDSVRVPELMVVEPYTTVHQLISTVTGALQRGRTPVECVRACFPGGSMTGAPKLRTMEIIDDIEREARGAYSGALGYFGLDGSVDLSIVIRTIVMRPGATTIGAGGAIVMQSDPQEEFEEILLKAHAPMAAIAQAVTGSDAPGAWTVELEPTTTTRISRAA